MTSASLSVVGWFLNFVSNQEGGGGGLFIRGGSIVRERAFNGQFFFCEYKGKPIIKVAVFCRTLLGRKIRVLAWVSDSSTHSASERLSDTCYGRSSTFWPTY